MIRASAKQYDMACWCFKSGSILRLKTDVLTELASTQHIRVPRNSTKAAKIRMLAASPVIKANCSTEELADIEKALLEMDEKRKRKAQKEKTNESEEEDEDRPCQLQDAEQMANITTQEPQNSKYTIQLSY